MQLRACRDPTAASQHRAACPDSIRLHYRTGLCRLIDRDNREPLLRANAMA
jgi:hypothetical protein